MKTLKIKELKLEVTKVLQKNTAFEDIVIPEGWDIPTIQQCIDLVNNKEFCDFTQCLDGKNDFFIKQPFKVNKDFIARFYADSDRVSLDCYWNRDDSYAQLGVLLVRKI